MEFILSQEIKNLDSVGVYLFGTKRTIPMLGKKDVWASMCTIYLSHSRSPKISRDKKGNMAIPATLLQAIKIAKFK